MKFLKCSLIKSFPTFAFLNRLKKVNHPTCGMQQSLLDIELQRAWMGL